MSAHFVELLEHLHRRCVDMSALVEAAVDQAADALVNRDAALAATVLENEAKIDAEEVEIERASINLCARHQPAATDLRTVFAVVKINSDLERIGDCAANIAQLVGPFAAAGSETPHDIRVLADSARQQVRDTTRCLAARDVAVAEQVCRNDDVVDALYHQAYQDLQAGMVANTGQVPADLALIMAAKYFERIGDHCTNIAEEIIYLVRGEIVRHVH